MASKRKQNGSEVVSSQASLWTRAFTAESVWEDKVPVLQQQQQQHGANRCTGCQQNMHFVYLAPGG